MKSSRSANAVRNSLAGIIGQLSYIFISFVTRTYFIRYLGTENLGFDALFSNVISVLSILDLGMSTSLSFSLYKYLHDFNYDKTLAILSFFRRIFISLGIVLLFLSFLFAPHVSILVDRGRGFESFYLSRIFLLYAISSFSSYFFVDKRILLSADQKDYILSICDSVIKILVKIFQILILYKFAAYEAYLLVEIFWGIIGNLIISTIAHRNYSFKENRKIDGLSQDEKKFLLRNTWYVFLNKVAGVGINSTDNILVSMLLSTILLGKYSNYNLIIVTGYTLVDKLLMGVTASMGNLFVENDYSKQHDIILALQFINSVFSSIVFLFLFFFTPDLIFIWLGNEMTINIVPVFVVCFNQYLYMTRKTLEIIMQTKGVFKEIVPYKIEEMIINLFISYILGEKIGLSGIFIGSTISIIYSFFRISYVLIKKKLDFSYKQYMFYQLEYFIKGNAFFVIMLVLKILLSNVNIAICMIRIILSALLFVVYNYILYRKNTYFKIVESYVNILVKR